MKPCFWDLETTKVKILFIEGHTSTTKNLLIQYLVVDPDFG